jgi:anti-sigma regulatory factor (Ser/Thr protein kinase)
MTETVLSLERTSDAPREARGRVRHLQHLIGPDRIDDATLLVSELVTNAVKYGPAPGGHRLRIVDVLADRWGVERGSTRVRFELDG